LKRKSLKKFHFTEAQERKGWEKEKGENLKLHKVGFWGMWMNGRKWIGK